jgi:signal peptidase I
MRWQWGAALLLGGLVVRAIRLSRRRWVFVTVRGESMAPTLRDGQRLLARRNPQGAIQRGDVVVFRAPDADDELARRALPAWRVKRVVGLAGDRVPEWLRAARSAAGERIPAGHFVVRGDNTRSEDSRQLGFIPIADIIAVVDAGARGTASGG